MIRKIKHWIIAKLGGEVRPCFTREQLGKAGIPVVSMAVWEDLVKEKLQHIFEKDE